MSNEELAVQAQAGDKRALFDLWENVRRLLMWYCQRVYICHGAGRVTSAGVTLEDMQQKTLISRYFNGNSLKQCAQAIDVPTGDVRKLEREGLRQLRYPQAKKPLAVLC